jgi:hypothetical protein
MRLAVLFLLLAFPLFGGPRVIKGQKVPDQKRTLEIQHALVEKVTYPKRTSPAISMQKLAMRVAVLLVSIIGKQGTSQTLGH